MHTNASKYVAQLKNLGMQIDDAIFIVNDFLHELDFIGLTEYISEFRQIRSEAIMNGISLLEPKPSTT